MKQYMRHAGHPTATPENAPMLAEAETVCGAKLREERESRITYNRHIVQCIACLRRLSRFPQLLPLMDRARSPELPEIT